MIPLYHNAQSFPFHSLRRLAHSLDWPDAYSFAGNHPRDRENTWSNEAQGISNDNLNWFVSQKSTIWKIPLSRNLGSNFSKSNHTYADIPKYLSQLGYNHFGDIDHHNGYIFAPLEQDAKDLSPLAVVFHASSLDVVGWHVLSKNAQKKQAAWCAVNPRNGILYTSDFNRNPNHIDLFLYNISWNTSPSVGDYLGSIRLTSENGDSLFADRIQGGAFSDSGHLYLVIDSHTQKGGIWAFDMLSGRRRHRINVSYKPTSFGFTKEELEGITILRIERYQSPKVKRSQVHMVMIDNDASGKDDVFIKHFRVPAGQELFV